MRQFSFLPLLFLCSFGFTQNIDQIISVGEVSRIEQSLSHDSMQGRATFTPGIEKAAAFIENEFKKIGLDHFGPLQTYRQEFHMIKQKEVSVEAGVNGLNIPHDRVISIGTDTVLSVTEKSGLKQLQITNDQNLLRTASAYINQNEAAVVWVAEEHKEDFGRLSLFTKRARMEDATPLIFILHPRADRFSVNIRRQVEKNALANVVGVIPGKSKKDEVVVFSAHYDHLGIGKPNDRGDSIYNGANDDASGTTAVIMLANYFKALEDNERTLVFVAFTAEEIGGFGSRYFSRQIDPAKVVAMFNIEMIGTDSKWGKNSAYITGYEKSDFGPILQKNLEGSRFRFEPDPYPEQQLFYRSDNATLAALGVPAHTISTSKMDVEPHYHKQSDEYETLDMENMTEVIRGIAISSKTIVAGQDTPSRVSD